MDAAQEVTQLGSRVGGAREGFVETVHVEDEFARGRALKASLHLGLEGRFGLIVLP
jgi:hypothetical protein